MKPAISLWIAVLLTVGLATPALAQQAARPAATQQATSLDGDWEGALHIGDVTLNLVFHVRTVDGASSFTIDSPDQNAMAIPGGAASLDGRKVTLLAPSLAGVFNGDLSADDASIAGTWSQNGNELPLSVRRK